LESVISIVGAALVFLGSLLLKISDKLRGLGPDSYFNVGGLVLFVLGNPAVARLRSSRTSLSNHKLSLDTTFLTLEQGISGRFIVSPVTFGRGALFCRSRVSL